MKKIREDQLWDYAEGRLSGPEKTDLDQWLAADPRNRQQLEEVRMLSSGLLSMEAEEPSMRFTARVMEAWDREMAFKTTPLQTHTDKRIVYGIAGLLAATLLFSLGLLFSLSDGSALFLGGNLRADGSFFSGLSQTLGSLFAGLSYYFIVLIMLLSMVLAERYLHYRQYIRNVQ